MSPQDQLLNGYAYSQNEIFNPGSAYQFNAKAMYTTLAGDELGSGDTLQDVNKRVIGMECLIMITSLWEEFQLIDLDLVMLFQEIAR